MTPFMAKRLAIALEDRLRRHEAVHGPIWPDSNGVERRTAEKASPEKALLLGLVNSLQIDLGAERSFKVFRDVILTDRFLLSARSDAVPREKTLDICRRLGLPDPFWAPLLQNLPDTKFVHFGFEENEKGSIYKVYLELNFKSRHYPFLVYLGFKWDTRDAARRAVARYTCLPFLYAEGHHRKGLPCLRRDRTPQAPRRSQRASSMRPPASPPISFT